MLYSYTNVGESRCGIEERGSKVEGRGSKGLPLNSSFKYWKPRCCEMAAWQRRPGNSRPTLSRKRHYIDPMLGACADLLKRQGETLQKFGCDDVVPESEAIKPPPWTSDHPPSLPRLFFIPSCLHYDFIFSPDPAAFLFILLLRLLFPLQIPGVRPPFGVPSALFQHGSASRIRNPHKSSFLRTDRACPSPILDNLWQRYSHGQRLPDADQSCQEQTPS